MKITSALVLALCFSAGCENGNTDADAGSPGDGDTGLPEDAGTCLPAVSTTPPLELRTSTNLRTYYPDRPVPLHVTVENTSGEELLLPADALEPGAFFGSVVLEGPDGEIERMDGVSFRPSWQCPASDGSVDVVAGEADLSMPMNSVVPDLHELFAFEALGMYRVHIELPLVTYSEASDGVAREDDVEFCCQVVGAPTRFEIVELVEENIEPGGTYGAYSVESISLMGAPAGDYTFHVADPVAGMVEVRRDATSVATVEYTWSATVTPVDSYSVVFPDLFTISVLASAGSHNLYGIDQSIFDGARFLRVE